MHPHPHAQELVELYHRELYRLASLPPESLLTVHLQARARRPPPLLPPALPGVCGGQAAPAACCGAVPAPCMLSGCAARLFYAPLTARLLRRTRPCCLQAGLTVLNNPAAAREGGSKEDPLHLPAFRALAKVRAAGQRTPPVPLWCLAATCFELLPRWHAGPAADKTPAP